MKVVFLFGGLPHYYNFILNRINNLPNTDVTVIIPEGESKSLGAGVHQSEEGVDFNVVRLPEFRTFYGKFFFGNLAETISELAPDIIVVSYAYAHGFVIYPSIKKVITQRNIKVVLKTIPFEEPYRDHAIRYHSNVWMKKANRSILLKPVSYLLAYIYTVVSSRLFNTVDAHVNYIEEAYDLYGSYGVDKSKIFITYNSPDTDELEKTRDIVLKQPKKFNSSSFRLLHIGRLVAWKRVDMLIQAIDILKEKYSEIELFIVGGGPEEENLKGQTKALNLTERITFLGAIYDPVLLGQIMNESSIYVLAGKGGLSINENMQYGLPIICSVADGTEKKLVRNGENGYFFEDGNLNDLVSKIDKILSSQDNMKEMGKKSREIILNEVNVDVVIANYKKAFDFVLKDM